MKKINMIMAIFIFSLLPLFAQFSGGSGTALDPYQVATKVDLNNVRSYLSSYFIQTSNIMFAYTDFQSGGTYYNAGSLWEPIGIFTGTYDGNNLVIDSIKINRTSSSNAGVFGEVSGATAIIKNLGATNVNIIGNQAVGGLVGFNNDHSTISNSYSSSSVTCSGQYIQGITYDSPGATPEVNPIPGLVETVNVAPDSRTTYSGDGSFDGLTVVLGNYDFELTGNITAGLIKTTEVGRLVILDLSPGSTKTFPITDGVNNFQ